MEKKVNSYRLFCEAKLKEVLIDNLQPKKQRQPKYKKALADAGIEDMAHVVNQRWFGLGWSVTQLLAAHLGLDPTWNYLERWLDNSEFSSITVTNSNTITVAGSLWWGYNENIGGAQTPEAIEAEFVLAQEQLSYSIRLYADDLCRHITNAGLTRTLIETPATSETDLSALLASLKNKGENAPPKSPILHMGFGPILHNINYLTAYTIAQSGTQGIEALLELLKENDIELQSAAVYALGLIGEKAHSAIPVILAVLPDAKQQFRCLAAVALCLITTDSEENLALLRSLVPDLLKALNKQNFEDEDLYIDTSDIAGKALTELARRDPDLLPLFIQTFENGETQYAISRIFYKLGSTARQAIPALAKAIHSADNEERWSIVRALSQMGMDGIQILIEKINDNNRWVRYPVVFTLKDHAKDGTDDLKPIIPALLQALHENRDDAKLFCAIALSLAHIDLQDWRIIKMLNAITPALIRMIQHPDSFTACMAIETLDLIGASAAELVPVLIAGLRDEEKDDVWRKAALKALCNICTDIDLLTPLLIDLIKERGWLAEDAIDMLVASGSPKAIAEMFFTLSELLKDKDEDRHGFSHYNVFKTLQKIGHASMPLLVDLSQGDDSHLRHSAVRTLGHFGKQAVPYLIQALASSDTRSTAAQALGEIGADASVAIASLENALSDPELDVCARAAEALGRIGKQSVPALIRALKSEDSFAAMWAAAVLGRMGRDASEAIPALVEALHHNDAQVRELATKALHQQGIC